MLAGEREWLLERVAEQPALTPRGLVERNWPIAAWHFFEHEGITFKKEPDASEQDPPDVARRKRPILASLS